MRLCGYKRSLEGRDWRLYPVCLSQQFRRTRFVVMATGFLTSLVSTVLAVWMKYSHPFACTTHEAVAGKVSMHTPRIELTSILSVAYNCTHFFLSFVFLLSWNACLNERPCCRLLAAEDAVLAAGGIAIRLVGLYHAGRQVSSRQDTFQM